MRLHDASSKLGTSVPVVEDWVNIILTGDAASSTCGQRDKLHLHQFAMVVIVENVCATFRETQPDEASTMSFCNMYDIIARETMNLPEDEPSR